MSRFHPDINNAARSRLPRLPFSHRVGKNISFDQALHEKASCDIHLFDPTPVAIDYMKKFREKTYLKFHPWGVWIEDKSMKFYVKKENKKNQQQNLSLTNLFNTNEYIELECFTLKTIMKKLSHDRIDLLKMDIEGSAMDVLEQLIQKDICPKQIVFELEKGQTPILKFHVRMGELLQKISKSYFLYFLPRSNKERYNFHCSCC